MTEPSPLARPGVFPGPAAVPFETVAWRDIHETHHSGDTGEALWRSHELGGTRVRMVTYSPGYLADHWCSRGHVLLVLEGSLTTELDDGRTVVLKAGDSYVVSDRMEAHRSRTDEGARLFIVD
ncbi:MAG: hypothetical protein JWP75_913 [Frondihabitans sp.]|nr:hypothetical protein [Frondihabitans sp.]